MNLLQIEAFNRSNVPNSNLASRISTLEEQIRSSPLADTPIRGMRRVLQRLGALEARMNNGTSGVADVDITAINRRIRRLENQVNYIANQLSADNCSSNPCKNGGQCWNIFNGYMCKCTELWEGRNCEDDVNECANFAGTDLGCQNMAICENFAGGYRCKTNTITTSFSNRDRIIKIMRHFQFSDVDARTDGTELIAPDELLIACKEDMSCVGTELVYIPMTQMVIDAFVIKVGLVMVQHQLVIKILTNANHQLHTVQWIQKWFVSIYRALIHAANVHTVKKSFTFLKLFLKHN